MKTTGDATPIRVSGPAGLLAAVPPMLGFHPTNSLVLMCLSGDRRRIGPVARVDLPAGHDLAMARQLTGHARNHADEVVVISYQDGRRRPQLLDDVLIELDRAGVVVMDAIVVRGGRARPGLNAAIERAHPGVAVPGAGDPQVAALTAAGALAGRSVLANRDQLRRSIAGPTGARLAAAKRAVDEVLAGHIRSAEQASSQSTRSQSARGAGASGAAEDRAAGGRPVTATGSAADQPVELDAISAADEESAIGAASGDLSSVITELINRAFAQVTATGTVPVRVAIELVIELNDVLVRDAVLATAVVQVDQPWLPLLIACATWTPDFLAGELCSVLSVVAYRHGDGALAQLAVDRCLAVEPRHPLAQLMISIMAAGARPEELERSINRPAMDCFEQFGWDGIADDEEDLDERASEEPELWWG
ncbi:MAG: DUF4192 domain-containing protein [Nakamurella sp.]